ncbi:polysaccharide biosynthesis protein [Butyrivibrio sp. WCD3002]|uniref:polysaccharide biosynthesis protein n=1 Tax=Butyrivibrio sp. WCD3002 TaxID=1280676 RepID=UPI00041EED04|nr:nucleoside-diphosphate sugar epimerase/dehydratase [Butyrivibrio sp. WCD3002]
MGNFYKATKRYYALVLLILIADILSVVVSYVLALLVRFDFRYFDIPQLYRDNILILVPCAAVTTIAVYYVFRLYHSIWRFASLAEVYRTMLAYFVLSLMMFAEIRISFLNIPRSCLFIAIILNMIFCLGIRFSYRVVKGSPIHLFENNDEEVNERDNVMIIGAGHAARELLTDLKLVKSYRVRVLVDDNRTTWGRYLQGIKIGGGRDDIVALCKKYDIDRIIYAIPSAPVEDRREILNICKETGCKLQTVPGLLQIVSGEVSISKLRDVNLEDLLERDEVKVNNSEIFSSIKDKVCMVTGGGGSIGSELCRQIAAADPKQLIIFDIYENNAYQIEQELKRAYPQLDVQALIGSVRNTSRIRGVLKEYRPDIIFHAAAHKHVPLMEKSPNEAVKNNVMGTYKTALAAANYGVKRFVMISTDKAVNPTSLMGATKRICEMIIQMMDRKYPDTVFSAVRFGNVLGSNGSVIPLFKQQIAEGGPVTVTDKNMVRYFMTVPEAVSLVLQASYYAKGGEIFVLDMGKPVKIDDMARNLIKLSGLKPDEDIKIVYTGLRPGEKMYEEILMDEEGKQKTANNMIYIGRPIDMNDELFAAQLDELDAASKKNDANIKQLVAKVVDTYHPEKESSPA